MTLSLIAFIVPSVMGMLVGLLHLSVHYRELETPDVEKKFASVGTVPVFGQPEAAWPLWSGMSWMMGALIVLTGALNLASVIPFGGGGPSVAILVVNFFVASAVIFSGVRYFTRMHVIGGVLSLALYVVSLVASF